VSAFAVETTGETSFAGDASFATGECRCNSTVTVTPVLERAGITEQTVFTLFYYTNQSSECGLQD
jgi:hypothetical protein